MRLAKTSWRSIRQSARVHGITITEPHPGSGAPLYKIGERWANVRTLYHGGDSVVQHLDNGADLALVQAGASGEWYAVLSARTLFEIMQHAQTPEAANEIPPTESESPNAPTDTHL